MAEHSVTEALLNDHVYGDYGGKSSCFPFFLKWVLKIFMWVIFITWVLFIFFFHLDSVNSFYKKMILSGSRTIFGLPGLLFLVFSGPVMIIVFLAIIYVAAFPKTHLNPKRHKFPKFRLWTFPLLIDGPLGIVSAGEFIGIFVFLAYVLGAVSIHLIQDQQQVAKSLLSSKDKRYNSCLMLEQTGLHLGSIGLFLLGFLFLPITRGSFLLRLIDIPFEHATRYHVWLGHLTMAIFTAHGVFYSISWAMQGHLLREWLEWKNIGVANVCGVISLFAGLLMWVTSLYPVRKQHFELFFYTHQLYAVFIIFFVLHVGDFVFSIASGGIFLFLVDRFLRFCQSRSSTDIISASCLPCGTIELVLSKPRDLKYNALSFIFLQVKELSWLQWHPFSVSSSPLDGERHVSILIKVLGDWTEKLRDKILNSSGKTKITTSIEGPYGHESEYHLMYEHLILVAGGIGISPFLAILSDILHRLQEKKPCLPKSILLVWAVKTSKEFSLLSLVDVKSICPSFPDSLNLDIQIFVTQESEPFLEDCKFDKSMSIYYCPFGNGGAMSGLVGTGNNFWSGIYVVICTTGFVLLFGLCEVYLIKPLRISSWWLLGLLFFSSMIASIVSFGGLVIVIWNYWEKILRGEKFTEDFDVSESSQSSLPAMELGTCENLANLTTTHYGKRPDFHEIFNSASESWGHVDVGVIVCGPPSLQVSVAKECRSQNVRGKWKHPIFHFNSHSFDL